MLASRVQPINNWNRDYAAISYGNYGYGIYTQDFDVHRNPFTGYVYLERDLDFIPLGNNTFSPYRSFPMAIHQHYQL
ncbi:unnamed protein product [Rotaria socialis]|uniref:Uncharacterized protein n=1 Tax=Rotaria socialis TaxID=392032 RepID=A0A820NC37_9BILA|nr:unnamed protein product [Rotaria socialis]CAF3471369.1 unnamed protein product [Rotaria socialis]CAF4218675.1 unnamed protein product [Rotaria socialis]CAF4388349.1 unnamed protein product [Rotaria socialis]CAF4489859.1 unnamed protein product [Rotaria socialis]